MLICFRKKESLSKRTKERSSNRLDQIRDEKSLTVDKKKPLIFLTHIDFNASKSNENPQLHVAYLKLFFFIIANSCRRNQLCHSEIILDSMITRYICGSACQSTSGNWSKYSSSLMCFVGLTKVLKSHTCGVTILLCFALLCFKKSFYLL